MFKFTITFYILFNAWQNFCNGCDEFHLGEESRRTTLIELTNGEGQISLWPQILPSDTSLSFKFLDDSKNTLYELILTARDATKLVFRDNQQVYTQIILPSSIIKEQSWTVFHFMTSEGTIQLVSFIYEDAKVESIPEKNVPELLILNKGNKARNNIESEVINKSSSSIENFIMRIPLQGSKTTWRTPTLLRVHLKNNALFSYRLHCLSNRYIWDITSDSLRFHVMKTTELIAWCNHGVFLLIILLLVIYIFVKHLKTKNKTAKITAPAPPLPPKTPDASLKSPLVQARHNYINRGYEQ